MQISATYGNAIANILIDRQPWGADSVTVRFTDYDVLRAARKDSQTLKVVDHISIQAASGDNVCCRCIIK